MSVGMVSLIGAAAISGGVALLLVLSGALIAGFGTVIVACLLLIAGLVGEQQ